MTPNCPLNEDCSLFGTYAVKVRKIDPTTCADPLSDNAKTCWTNEGPSNELTLTSPTFTMSGTTVNKQSFTVNQWEPGQFYYAAVVVFTSDVTDTSGNNIELLANYFWMRNEAISECPDPYFEIDPACIANTNYEVKLDNIVTPLDCNIVAATDPAFTGTNPCPLFCSAAGTDTLCPNVGTLACHDTLVTPISYFDIPDPTFTVTLGTPSAGVTSISVQSADASLDQKTFNCLMRSTTPTPKEHTMS